MTPYDLLREACALSQREAAELHGVRIDTVKSWCVGRNAAPDGVMAELRALFASQDRAARELVKTFPAPSAGVVFEFGFPADDHEARALGFPCVGAWKGMARLVMAGLTRADGESLRIRFVPRGSTPATAAAIAAHEC